MLDRDKVIQLILVGFLILSSCGKRVRTDIDPLAGYVQKHFQGYKNIYENAKDSVNKWINDSLKVTGLEFNNSWKLDSILCFNSDSTRMFSSILIRDTIYKSSTMDGIVDFGGARINGKWYFFLISNSLVVPRGLYQDSLYCPLTFEELSYVSHTQILKSVIVKNEDGNFESREDYFKKNFFNSNSCRDCESLTSKIEFDSLVLKKVQDKYNYKLDKEEIAEIKEEMAKSVRPPEPEKSWWDKWFGPTKVFESEEWKNRKEKGI